ncbi:hypothetical protein [Amycolatopsis rubida]|uniref:Uncharacterized protein n=1 Tax=Amycolatopsis rubida TaxID=112413 RepID=A0A1I5IFD5_9PSEU|nr:hypothetical protein [Amycolatopsis rubida]SFO59388.1 hypothetical protein SAMN05421854_102446 [Amycolatopsis rubida]
MTEAMPRRKSAPISIIVLRLVIAIAVTLTYWALHASWYADGQGLSAGTILWAIFDIIATVVAIAFVVTQLVALYRSITDAPSE